MEYTDAPSTQTEIAGETMECPICDSVLPKDADRCDRCGWQRQEKSETAEGKASDAVAVLLSVIPGLGHIYKGHRLAGIVLIIATPMAVALALLAATGTAGFGILLLPIYWLAVMFHVYAIEDRVAPTTAVEGEQY